MNNISDITTLVAVLALALWPAIIIYLSWRREKKIINYIKNDTSVTNPRRTDIVNIKENGM